MTLDVEHKRVHGKSYCTLHDSEIGLIYITYKIHKLKLS